MSYTIQQLAKLAGVSIRTLHHYDDIGLLTPSRSTNNYRTYEENDLLLLQQILFFRELDFSLEDIRSMLAKPDFDIAKSLQSHRKEIEKKQKRLQSLIGTIDNTLAKIAGEREISDDALFEAFWEKHEKEYAAEAQDRWGNTDAYKQSIERTKHMTKEDHKRLAQEGRAFMRTLTEYVDEDPASEAVQQMIATHYESLRTYYDPSTEIYRGLAEMYTHDDRFRAYFEEFHPKMPEFIHDAIIIFCDQKEGH